MFWKQKDNRDLTARRMASDVELQCKLLEKRVYLLEHPEEAEKERILELQERVEKGYKVIHNYYTDFYTAQQLKRWSQEISDYYAKKVKEYAGREWRRSYTGEWRGGEGK